ncbi:MAG: MFS transporter [Actinomycetia bacterium]|nr:MFS transporter [Actinomycetes bacterium]
MSHMPPASPAPVGAASDPPSPGEQRGVIAIVLVGVSLVAVDTTIVVLGLPVMMQELHASLARMVWVMMAYLLVLTMLATQLGRLGDMYGRVRMYNAGFALFTLGSVLCGLSLSSAALIASRVVQGIGGALVTANSGAIIADAIPAARRGRAFGITGMGWSLGAILGILLGGVLITYVNWRAIFFINLPIGVAALAAGRRILRDRAARVARRLDLPGIGLMGAGLFALLWGLTQMTGEGFDALVAGRLGVAAVLLGAFAVWERRAAAPLLDFSLFRHRVLVASILAATFQALGGYAVMFLVIMYLQGVRGLSPFTASMLLVPSYLVGSVIGPWAGRLADRHGARWPATLGLLVQALGIALYASLSVDAPLWRVVLAAVVNGIGNSAFFPANNSAVVVHAPRDAYGVANGLLRTFSNVGMVSSFAVALLMASEAIPRWAAFAIFLGVSRLAGPLRSAYMAGFHAALALSIALVLVAAGLSYARDDRRSRASAAAAG